MLRRVVDKARHAIALRELEALLIGRTLTARETEGQWNLISDGEAYIHAWSWRLVGDNHIVVASEDHEHRFGLPKPINAVEKFNTALGGEPVARVEVSSITGDLAILFSGGIRLEIPTRSSGYESWSVGRKEDFSTLFVGANGGFL
ncbi:hypothetical protein [Qipengyuania mesophila]|uniref:hypothetical protein n=1 Tax=Qipengyuania mesophila TaxID=2867246 RepID=UPI003517B8BB